MQSFVGSRITRLGCAVCTVAILLSGCSSPPKLSPGQLASLGVKEGAMYWDAEQKLMQAGYSCYVSGAKRESFDCTKNTGFFPSCIHRVQFEANDQNLVSNLRIVGPACIGTP
jgi:hypothetical protein